jgi:hypothetical protein
MIDLTEDVTTRDEESLQTAADDFRDLLRAPGWAAFCAMVSAHSDAVARLGHYDDEMLHLPGYYRGYLTALEAMSTAPRKIVDAADAHNRELERQAETLERIRLKQPLSPDLLAPLDDGARILRGTFGGDEEPHL